MHLFSNVFLGHRQIYLIFDILLLGNLLSQLKFLKKNWYKMEVRHELSRIHKNQLRATLLGASTSHQGQGGHPSGTECPSSSSCPVATTSTSTSGPAVTALPIYHLEEISDPSKGYRVSHPDMELFKRQKLGYLFTDGEENVSFLGGIW